MANLQQLLDDITDDIRMSHHQKGSKMMPNGVAKSTFIHRDGWFYDDPRLPGYLGLGENSSQGIVDSGVKAALANELEEKNAEIQRLRDELEAIKSGPVETSDPLEEYTGETEKKKPGPKPKR